MANITIQPSNKDNLLGEGNPNTNYGTEANLQTRAHLAGYSIRSLVEFPVVWGTDIPAGAIITLAQLKLYYYYYYPTGYGNPVGRTIKVDRLLRLDWHETQSTPTIYKTGSNWTTAVAAGDILAFNVDSISTVTRVILSIRAEKS